MIITRVYNNGDRVYNGYLGVERCAEIAEELRIKIKEQLS